MVKPDYLLTWTFNAYGTRPALSLIAAIRVQTPPNKWNKAKPFIFRAKAAQPRPPFNYADAPSLPYWDHPLVTRSRFIVEKKLKSGKMASTGDIWLQWFSCCFHQPQSPRRRRHHQRLQRIDRSMIGNPTNFVHTGHIGSNDVELSTNHLSAIQNQMQSKGGYEMNSLRLQACW